MSGTLYGVGLGPGDPGLVTCKAAALIGAARVVAYPCLAGQNSLARAIAADLIPRTALEIRIDIPMTSAPQPAQAAYDKAAGDIASRLDAGDDVVALCEGDPFFYGSFMYLFTRLGARYKTQIVPGVSSLTACAARAGLPLARRNDVMAVLPAPLPDASLAPYIDRAETLILIKVGRHLPRLRALLAARGRAGEAVYVERATMAGERVLPLARAPDPAPYFSMILIAKGAGRWM